jgi:hypothetical protein
MDSTTASYRGHRFPSEIISHAVWVYYRFCLSFRDVEDLLAERGITVSYETIRQWCRKFGTRYARRLKRREGRLGDTWYLDELFVTIQGQRQYLWRAVDQDGDVIDILVQPRRDRRAAHGGTSCLRCAMTRAGMRTTGPKSRISRRDSESDRCAGSSRLSRPSDFSRFTGSSRTCSALDGIS